MSTAQDTVVMRLDAKTQAVLVDQVRAICAASPLVRPHTPGGVPMRVCVTAAGTLGWVGDGAYRYDRRDFWGNPWPELPREWAAIANDVAGPHPWDSAIINWYDDKASLGWHCDVSEHDTSLPIVTISLGDCASWAIREERDQGPVSRCKLSSGDVTLLAGPTRNHCHTIERIIPEPLFSPLRARGRVSITLRVAGRG